MSSNTLRAFIAIELPAAQKAALGELRKRLEPRVKGLRWVGPGQLHLTLAFLGDVGVQAVPGLRRSLTQAVAEVEPFALEVRGIGAFPDLSRPRVLWAGIEGEAIGALHELRERVAGACREARCAPADDRFRPHVTLGRFASARHRPSPVDVAGEAGWSGGSFRVEAVAAIASELLPQGPAYTHLSRFGLKGSASAADA